MESAGSSRSILGGNGHFACEEEEEDHQLNRQAQSM
jgi:hypothetical protein